MTTMTKTTTEPKTICLPMVGRGGDVKISETSLLHIANQKVNNTDFSMI